MGSSNPTDKNVQCRYCKDWGHMKWDFPKRPKGTLYPPLTQMGTIDQAPYEHIYFEVDAAPVQRLEYVTGLFLC